MMISSSFLSASLMMATVGILAWVVLRRVSVNSWRLRSWLVGAVLLQGLMVVRSPIHLGLIESPPARIAAESLEIDAELPRTVREAAPDDDDGRSLGATVLFASQTRTSFWQRLNSIDWSATLIGVWLTVGGTMIVLAISRYARVVASVRYLVRAPDQWRQQWRFVIERSSVSGAAARCEMLVSQSVGPLMVRRVTGYSLIVPESYWRGLTTQQRRGVMLHELAHLERGDVWRQLIARMIATIHWFNPIAWWALRQYECAAECACDQRVANDGKQAAAGFAAALVDLVQWHTENRPMIDLRGGVGFQSMAAPPLSVRISRLLKPSITGDSPMKRVFLAFFAVALILVSFFQIRLTTAQEGSSTEAGSAEQLRVIDDDVARQLNNVASQLDLADPTTQRFKSLLDTTSGRIAIAGYLNALGGKSREHARAEAVPRFFEHHFTLGDDGKMVLRSESAEALQRWTSQSERLTESRQQMQATADDLASRLDTSSEAGGLFKRVLQDPQATVAILVFEMKNGSDVVARFISEALDRILVDQGNGTFRIVESKRAEAETQVKTFELASKLSKKLAQALPILATEYSTDDESHKELVGYLRNPMTAHVVSLHLARDNPASVAAAIEELYSHFEDMSTDTPSGLKIAKQEAWTHLKEIFEHVDRASAILPRVQERLAEIGETLSPDDPLAVRLAAQMKQPPMAVLVAAELPYAEADAGEELRALLSEVLIESDGKLSVNRDREDELAQKAREILQVCRQIRRHIVNIDEMLDQFVDHQFVSRIGDAGRYVMLDEVRRFAERHRPDPVALMRDDLLAQADGNQLRVRDDKREVVRRLVEQSEKVRAEEGNDDF